ncbi:MAG: COG1361 S-layer family protein [Candidatus Woesearchaeota archaeon]
MKTLAKQLSIALFLIVSMSTLALAQISVVSTNPDPIIAGEYADITVQFRQGPIFAGDKRTDVEISLIENEFIRPIPDQTLHVREIFENQVVSRTFRAYFTRDIPPGFIPIKVLVKDSRTSVEYQDNILIRETALDAQLRIGQVRSIPNKLIADTTDNQLQLTLENLGDRRADLLKITLEANGISQSYFNSLQTSISSIEPGQQEVITFDFDIDKKPNNINTLAANLFIEYRERNRLDTGFQTRTAQLPFEIILTDAPNFVFTNIEPERPIQVGVKDQTIRATITNENQRKGENVRLRLFPDPASPFDFEKTTYFVTPRLEQNKESSVLIEFDVLPNAITQEYIVLAQIESFIGQNRFVQTKELIIDVQEERPTTIRQNAIAIIIALVVIASIIGFFSFKKRK